MSKSERVPVAEHTLNPGGAIKVSVAERDVENDALGPKLLQWL